MISTPRTLVMGLIAAILAFGGAAVYLLELDVDAPEKGEIGGVERFVARSDGATAPLYHFWDGEGRQITLEDFRGRIVLLNLWATWCAPCVRELPALDKLQAQLEPAGVSVVALSVDREGADAVRRFYAQNGIRNLKVYVDPTMGAQNAFGADGFPTTILIDKLGRDRGRLIGPADWDDAEAADLVLSAAAP